MVQWVKSVWRQSDAEGVRDERERERWDRQTQMHDSSPSWYSQKQPIFDMIEWRRCALSHSLLSLSLRYDTSTSLPSLKQSRRSSPALESNGCSHLLFHSVGKRSGIAHDIKLTALAISWRKGVWGYRLSNRSTTKYKHKQAGEGTVTREQRGHS